MKKEVIDYGKVTGMVHSTESFGAVDGPGIRFIVFLQGCKMRCQYCHNPDTWAMETNNSRERTVEDVLQEALRYRGFWGKKGGITVSGGEALLQINFVTALFTKAKELGIHCTLDTCAMPFRNTPEYLNAFDKAMIHFVKESSLLGETPQVQVQDIEKQILVFSRGGYLFVFSFNPTKAFVDYAFPIYAGKYTYVLNTDNPAFGGQGLINEQTEHFTQYINHQNLISLYIPPRIGLVLKRE